MSSGDVNGDNVADIITGAGPGGGPHVKVFNGNDLKLLQSFLAYDANFQGGVYVGRVLLMTTLMPMLLRERDLGVVGM